MTVETLSLNGVRAVSVRKVTPWTGAWFADVDIDTGIVPSGRISLVVGDATCSGTVDPRSTGKIGEKTTVRIIGGAAGWDKQVTAKHFHNDGGVLLSVVLAATAAEVGEVMGTVDDAALGVDFVRTAGTASQVLHGLDWYVDDSGITHVTAHPTVTSPTDADVISWDAENVTLAYDGLVAPGWVVTDAKYGTLQVRDVEQTWTESGARAIGWVSETPRSRLSAALKNAVRVWSNVDAVKAYPYRVFFMAGTDKAQVQATESTHPDLLPAPIWYGVPGCEAMLTPGTNVIVEFTKGDRTVPVIRAFDSTPPLKLSFSPTVQFSALAPQVVLGSEAAMPIAHAIETISALTAITTALASVAAQANTLNASPRPALTSDLVTLTASLAAVAAAVAALTPTLPTILTRAA